MTKFMSCKKQGLQVLLINLIILIPIVLFGSTHNFSGEVSNLLGRFWGIITHSAGSSGFLITLFVLSLLVLTLKLPFKRLVCLGMQLAILLVLSFAAKTTLKSTTESPRPYTEFLAQQGVIASPQAFYELDIDEKNSVIDSIDDEVSQWKSTHWHGEKDYSFPSGHTIFVAICLAFFGGLFLEQRKYWLVAGLLVWAGCVAYSRLWLGMHRPIDLAGSIIFGAIIYTVTPTFHNLIVERWINRFIHKTE
ncbi:phosphatase PAP2 family protein [Vibrio makurazakiensis]|uniref:phosphatase PAP2 family protein n=1 Tax=Vibrio makurazakiensis TaxID=2910250 RepID=UPI003D0E5F68